MGTDPTKSTYRPSTKYVLTFCVAPPIFLLSSHADGVRLKFRGDLHDPELDGGGNLVYWYDADSESAAPEPEKPKGPKNRG